MVYFTYCFVFLFSIVANAVLSAGAAPFVPRGSVIPQVTSNPHNASRLRAEAPEFSPRPPPHATLILSGVWENVPGISILMQYVENSRVVRGTATVQTEGSNWVFVGQLQQDNRSAEEVLRELDGYMLSLVNQRIITGFDIISQGEQHTAFVRVNTEADMTALRGLALLNLLERRFGGMSPNFELRRLTGRPMSIVLDDDGMVVAPGRQNIPGYSFRMIGFESTDAVQRLLSENEITFTTLVHARGQRSVIVHLTAGDDLNQLLFLSLMRRVAAQLILISNPSS